IRPGPQTNSTVGNCAAGTCAVGLPELPPPIPSAAVTLPISPPPGGAVGNSSISSAASLVETPDNSAIPAITGLPSAIVSLLSITKVNENVSCGCPEIASGLLAACPGAAAPPV